MRRFRRIEANPDGTKYCPDCGTDKPLEDFPVRLATGVVYTYCKECNQARVRKWGRENRERKAATNAAWAAANADKIKAGAREKSLRRYGLTLECIEARLERQNHRCAICEKEINKKTLVVDHCHDSDRVRDLLCNRCNISLAPLEREGFLDKALAYLERHRSGS